MSVTRPTSRSAARAVLTTSIAIVWLALTLGADQSDQINTSGGRGNIVADARTWWNSQAKRSDAFRTQTQNCLRYLDEAEPHRLEARRLYDRGRDPRTPSREATRAVAQANAEYAIVTDLVRKFYVCARMPRGDQINTGGDPPVRASPTPSPTPTGDRIDTGGAGAPRPRPTPTRTPPRGDDFETGSSDPTGGRTRPTPRPTLTGRAVVERICDHQRLAALVFQRYNRDRPIARVEVVNASQPTYLLLLSGMEWERPNQATLVGDAFLAWVNIQALNVYRLGIMDAVADLPKGATLIVVGHSQGAMEAQNVVANLVGRWGFRVPQVISYGAPITADRRQGTSVLHVRARDEPLQALDRRYNLAPHEILFANNGRGFPWEPNGSHFVYDKPASGLSLYRVPSVSTLRTPCYDIDLTTIREFAAPNLFTRFLGAWNPRPSPGTPLNPGRSSMPIDVEANCFWLTVAQDINWATGVPIPARCEARPMRNRDIPPVLALEYGHTPLDDRHGPTREDGVKRHHDGEPARSSRQQLEDALTPEGSRGIVFVYLPDPKDPTKIDRTQTGHAFNVRRLNGQIVYEDAQSGQDPTFWFGTPDLHVFFYRTN